MLLGIIGPDGGNNAAVGDFVPNWYLVVLDEDNGFGAICHYVANAAVESAEIIDKGLLPYFGGRSLDKVTVILGLTSDRINNHIVGGDVDAGKGKELGGRCNRGNVIGGLGVASSRRVVV